SSLELKMESPLPMDESVIPHEKEMQWDWPLQTDDGVVKVINDEDKFEVHLDAQYFTPKEVKVKVIGRLVDICCEHTKRSEDRGDVSRWIARSYMLPDDVNEALVRSTLNYHGVLVITAIKKPHIYWPPRVVLHD
ncbi:hypothetical protein PMAYCL1PPCAC_05910, partial [Pristionchus mayeri]